MLNTRNANGRSMIVHPEVRRLEGDSETIDCYFVLNHLGIVLRDIGVSFGRNIFSVGLPTSFREYMRRGPLELLRMANPLISVGLGVGACVTPIVAEILGLARDSRNGRLTTISVLSRVLLIMAVGSTCITAAALGTFSGQVPALVASVFVYTPLRDTIQHFLSLNGSSGNGSSLSAIAVAGAVYFINQLGVSYGMDAVVAALTPSLGLLVANVIGRPLINIIGETVDDVVFAYLDALMTAPSVPRFTLGISGMPSLNITNMLDRILNINASRSSLFVSSFNLGGIFGDSPWANVASSGILSLAYTPFINVASHSTTSALTHSSAMERGVSPIHIPMSHLANVIPPASNMPSVHIIDETTNRASVSRQTSKSDDIIIVTRL